MIAKQRRLIAQYLRDQSVGIMLPELRGVVSHLPVEDIRQQLGDDAMRAWTDEAICNAVIYGRIEPAVKLENKLPPAWQFMKTKAAEQQQRFYTRDRGTRYDMVWERDWGGRDAIGECACCNAEISYGKENMFLSHVHRNDESTKTRSRQT
jgi:hypothetical protein